MTYEEIIKVLEQNSNPKNVEGMARFGISAKNTLGISIPFLRDLAKQIKKSSENRHELAQKLWSSSIHEARILAAMIDEVDKVTQKQMDSWAEDFDSWDVCDQVCMNLFAKLPKRSPSEAQPGRRRNESPDPYKKAIEWTKSDKEFVRRAGFALMACLAWHDKNAPDEKFKPFFPLIKKYSTDERNFVKKAVNWALRQIGKMRPNLKNEAIKTARQLEQLDNKTARWIASDALRELTKK